HDVLPCGWLPCAPNATALATLRHDLASCNAANEGSFQALYNPGESHVKNLLLICKKTRGRTPAPFAVAKMSVMKDLQSTPRKHSDAKLMACALLISGTLGRLSYPLEQALARDHFSCMVTGRVDFSSYVNGLTTLQLGELMGGTQCAHIFPDSLANIQQKEVGTRCVFKRAFKHMSPVTDPANILRNARLRQLGHC
ncbi:hypothetical protein BD311DRAFT_754078, partial [Dichomitus squalens]